VQKTANQLQGDPLHAVGVFEAPKASSNFPTSESFAEVSQSLSDKRLALNPSATFLPTGPLALAPAGRTLDLFRHQRTEARNGKHALMRMQSGSRLRRDVPRRPGFDTCLRASGTAAQPVSPSSRPLDEYMRLPVAQYALMPMPRGSALKRVDGFVEQFELEMPTLRFFSVEVKPIIFAQVKPTQNAVLISSQRCVIRGSAIVNSLGLNDRFTFDVKTKISWSNRTIYCKSEIRVDVNPPPVFAILPNKLLESTGNSVMRVALNFIQEEFLKALGSDFERWSRDDDYFAQRAKLLL